MKGGILSDTGKTAKQIAIDTARQIVREPVEILKNAAETIASPDIKDIQNKELKNAHPSIIPDKKKEEENQKRDLRLVQALENEMKDISRNKVMKEIQNKIANEEIIYFESYPELSVEQIEILKKQQYQITEKRKYEAQIEKNNIPTTSKKGRRFGSSRKQAAEKESTRTENPVPPSG